MRWAMAVLAVALAGGCAREGASTADAERGGAAVSAGATAPDAGAMDGDALRRRAEEALRGQRLHAPAGDSAVDLYLALRARYPDDAGVQQALLELQPYVVIAAEAALARGDTGDGARLVGLLGRVDAQAPALPRLQAALAAMRAEEARAVALSVAAADRPPQASMPAAAGAATPPPPAAGPATVPPPPVANQVAPLAVAPPVVTATPAPPPAPSSRPAPAETPPAPPRLLADVPPRYPAQALRRRIEGRVTVAVTVAPDGSVDDARVLAAEPARVFDDAALAAVRRWRFEPTGRAASVQRTLNFTLPGPG